MHGRHAFLLGQIDQEVLQIIPIISLSYLPLLMIPYVANTILLKSIVQERAGGAIIPMLCAGVNIGVVFVTRTIAVFSCCYLIFLLFVNLFFLLMVFGYTLPLNCTPGTVVVLMVTTPLTALSITTILHFVNFVFCHNTILTTILPLVTILVAFAHGASPPNEPISTFGVILSPFGSLAILAMCGFCVSKRSRARIADIYH